MDVKRRRFVSTIEQEISCGWVWHLISRGTQGIYLIYGALPTDDGKARTVTKVYDRGTYEELPEHRGSSFKIRPWSCLVNDGKHFYTNQRLFGLETEKENGKDDMRAALPVHCAGNRMLFLGSTAGKRTKLIIFDIHWALVLREIVFRRSLWVQLRRVGLYADGELVVRDEEKLVPVGQGRAVRKTGTLHIFDVESGKKTGSLPIPIGAPRDTRILASLDGGGKLLYASSDELFIVDLREQQVNQASFLPFGRLLRWLCNVRFVGSSEHFVSVLVE